MAFMKHLELVGATINAKETISSLEIAELTGKQHSHLLRDIRQLLDQGIDASNFGLVEYSDAKGEMRPCYNITKKGCLILASGYNPLLREKIINRWEELETEKRNGGFIIPKTFSEALMLAARQAEQIEQQQKQLAEQKPKVEFYDDVVNSKDSLPMDQVAKTLNMGIGRNKLFDLLRKNRILMNNNIPYQKFVDSGWFRCIETKYTLPTGDIKIYIKTVVLQKGLDQIRKIVRQTNK